MGRLDHVHIRVPDRAEAARWYAEHLGFEPVAAYDFSATAFEGGPLQDPRPMAGGRRSCLVEASEGHPMVPQQTGVAFSVDSGHLRSRVRLRGAVRDRQSRAAEPLPRSRISRGGASTCAGRSISSTRGKTSTSSTVTTTTESAPNWSRRTTCSRTATGPAEALPRVPRRRLDVSERTRRSRQRVAHFRALRQGVRSSLG